MTNKSRTLKPADHIGNIKRITVKDNAIRFESDDVIGKIFQAFDADHQRDLTHLVMLSKNPNDFNRVEFLHHANIGNFRINTYMQNVLHEVNMETLFTLTFETEGFNAYTAYQPDKPNDAIIDELGAEVTRRTLLQEITEENRTYA